MTARGGARLTWRIDDLHALSYRFAVCSDDSRLGRHVETLLAGLREEAAPVGVGSGCCCYALETQTDGSVDVRRDGEPVALAQRRGDAAGWVVWDVTRRAAATTGRDHLLLHAACLQSADGGGVLLPGPSGSGKSTLAAGLARAGLHYLSDELVALELARGRLLPYAKPISLKPASYGALGGLYAEARQGTGDLAGSDELLLAVGDAVGRPVGTACRPALVVVPCYEPGTATQLRSLSETEAFATLAVHAVNFAEHGADGLRALGDLVARCERVALTMSDLDDAVELVLGLASTRRPGCR